MCDVYEVKQMLLLHCSVTQEYMLYWIQDSSRDVYINAIYFYSELQKKINIGDTVQ